MDEIEELASRNCPVRDENDDDVVDMQTPGTTSVKGKHKRKLSSPVWNFFDRLQEKALDGKARCKCKKCGAVLICDSKNGTGSLKRHSDNCVRRDTPDVGQMFLSQTILAGKGVFDVDKFRELIAGVIIRHDLPLSFVEYAGVRAAFSYLRKDVPFLTKNDVEVDILKMHKREKDRVKCMLKETPSRICLTSSWWTSITTNSYLSLTAHFIDKDWILRKRVLNFSYLPTQITRAALSKNINVLLVDWGIENKLFSMTLDDASPNDAFVEMLAAHLNMEKALVGDGEFFHLRCCTHMLNSIVQDRFQEINEAIQKVRESVKHVKGSQIRTQQFVDCVNVLSLNMKKGLIQDVPTQWNSTFHMLEGALFYRRAFCHLELIDSNFKSCPCNDDWEKIEKTVNLLRVFYEITRIFLDMKYPTANLYFPSIFLARYTLQEQMNGSDEYSKMMARMMFSKFEKYWCEFNVILAIAVILDPRYKIQFVDWSYIKLYGHGSKEFRRVENKLFSLFDEYSMNSRETSSSTGVCGKEHFYSVRAREILEEFDAFDTSDRKTELQRFLDEPRLDRNSSLDILAFWKENQFRYPILAKMACDVLSIPISTVASESAFNFGGHILNGCRTALKDKTIDAIVCTKDWLYGESAKMSLNEHAEDVTKSDIEEDDLMSKQGSTAVPGQVLKAM